MFSKLLKYDLRAIAKTWCILAVSMLVFSVIGGFCLNDFIYSAENSSASGAGDVNGLLMILEFFSIMLLYFGIIAFYIVTFILLFIRFYRNFFTDEGYLTFTLPVSRTKLYLSKLVNSFIWNTATTAVIFGCVVIVLSIARLPDGSMSLLKALFTEILPQLKPAWNMISPWGGIWVAEFIVMIIINSLFSTMLIQLCITVGATIAKKAKVIVALALYYAASIVMGIASSVFSFAFPLWMAAVESAYPAAFGNENIYLLLTLGILLLCVVFAALNVILYLTNVTCLERKLNLA